MTAVRCWSFAAVLSVLAIAPVQAQTATLRGSVRDSAGNPVARAQILVVGVSRATLSDSSGAFRLINLPTGSHRVRASRLGYAASERTVAIDAPETTVEFRLARAASELEAVVVVGYGTQTSRNVTGSIASVSSEKLQGQMVEGVDKALAGQVAGVQVIQSNGVPGGGPQIQVRGVGSIGAGSQPLYVVDGYPLPSGGADIRNPLNDIPPGDIESISVLKDASSAAIYGSRAANGVVVITTKTGSSRPPRITVDYSAGMQVVPQKGRPDVLNAREFAQFMKELNEDRVRIDLGREPTAADVPAEYQNPAQYGEGTNWIDLMTRQAPTHNLNLSVSGGTANVGVYASGGMLREEGTILNTDFSRYSGRASVNATVSPRVRLGLNVAPTYTSRSLPAVGGNARFEFSGPGEAAISSPLISPKDANGNWIPLIYSPGNLQLPNALQYLDQFQSRTAGFRGIANAFVQYQINDWLKFESKGNVDLSQAQTNTYTPSTLAANLGAAPPRIPIGTFAENNYVDWLNENTLTLDQTVGQHHFNLLGVASVQVDRADAGNFTGTNYPDDFIRTLNGATLITGNSDVQQWGLLSFVSRLNYDLSGKYLVSAAIRRDGSSRFAPDRRWGVFPSIALGWRVSDEPFLKGVKWINDAKLRLSYGKTGNNDLGNYSYIGRVTNNDYVLNNALASGRVVSTLGNPDLGWERTQEVNAGFDLTTLGERLSFNFDAYNGITNDLLLNVQVPISSGFGTVTKNTGRIQNRGVEMAVHSTNMDRGKFRWTSDFTVAANRNKVLALGADGSPILAGRSGEGSPTNITQIGQPVGMFFGYRFLGLYKDAADVAASAKFPGAIPGNVKYKDVNGDGNITAITDFEVIGNPYPDATFGLTNSFKWSNLELALTASAQLGGEKLEGYNEYLHNIDGVFNVTRDVLDRWRSPSQPGSGLVPTTAGVSRGRVLYRDINSQWVHDASNIWLRNVTLRYRVPNNGFGLRLNDASVYVGIQNAAIITNYPGNPETNNYNRAVQAGPLAPGYDGLAYPIARVFTIGTTFGL